MKLLWVSNAPWCGTGYGQQTALVTPRLFDDGHDVSIACNYGLEGASTRWNGMAIRPKGWDQYSNDIIPTYAEEHLGGVPGDGWIVTLFDVWAFRNPLFQRFHTACWVPVDHRPVPQMVVKTMRDFGAVPIAMSRFGEEQLQLAGLDPLYAPHGVDTAVFCPGDRAEARDALGLPVDAFVVGMNAANKGGGQDRKSFFETFVAAAELMRQHDDVVLYLHTEKFGISGLNLIELADTVGIPDDRVHFVSQELLRDNLAQSAVAKMYRAFNVLAAPSRGEGFGIPVIEAQACGVPVIVSNFTAQPELVGDGWLVEGEPEWDEAHKATFQKPSIGSILEALSAAYDAGTDTPSAKALAHAAGYDADLVHAKFWRPIMADLEQRLPTIDPITQATPVNRAGRRRAERAAS